MNKFITIYILQPLAGKWLRGFLLLLLWTIAFIALPAISGWFLAICSVVFITANTTFSYLVPSAIIRLMAFLRTAMRYFERLENHKTTLDAQQSLQLRIFQSVAKFPYFKKQVNNNSTLLENSTHGIDQILNHILLWILPFTALILSLSIYFFFLTVFSKAIAIEFLISSSILLFIVPQLIFQKNRKLYGELKIHREDNNQALIQSFRGRIEISKYNLEEKAIEQYEQRLLQLEQLEDKLQTNSFWLQFIAGLGFSYIAAFLLWSSRHHGIDAPTAIGIFFGIMAQAELAEMLFSGKSEKSAVAHQIKDVDTIIKQGEQPVETVEIHSTLENLSLKNLSAKIPETSVLTSEMSLEIKKGEWIALFGETGKGKTTLLNSLFYPEYRQNGLLIWNEDSELLHLPVPECIYVTQKAYLLTGTLRENFEGYPDEAIEQVLDTVDLTSWRLSLPDGLNSWLGENGETLSGGQRKKLLLAQALLKKPQLLVVDEPTAGISSENAIAIFQNIKRLYPDISILMATHLKDFECVADKVVRI
ncbi:ATP-binding cassette domain-containing protein [Dysgonomonas sp. Marseille-P4677]|uniref:ATP-binding cassette domain-containing protein n=1 Tax=Dysgonomonas sp. Marseille-P4677 TaxID=2364790 RepID=UPI001914C1B0|nr:ATP-binding cassette domain-containing protein [Dysgonomonas sp. Marseille-P4677]MBK5719608.1 ATP-binding cassette domain-containing protein [Dysgonomonas sp. Marseille-P4677]